MLSFSVVIGIFSTPSPESTPYPILNGYHISTISHSFHLFVGNMWATRRGGDEREVDDNTTIYMVASYSISVNSLCNCWCSVLSRDNTTLDTSFQLQ